MYLQAEEQRALWRRAAELCARRPGSAFAFDLVPACEQKPPGAFGRLLERVMKARTGGRGFERDERTREDLARELREAGFGPVQLLEPAGAPAAWGLPYLDEPTQMLVFHARPAGEAP